MYHPETGGQGGQMPRSPVTEFQYSSRHVALVCPLSVPVVPGLCAGHEPVWSMGRRAGGRAAGRFGAHGAVDGRGQWCSATVGVCRWGSEAGLRTLGGGPGRPAAQAQARRAGAPRVSPDRVLRGQAGRPGADPGAGPDPGGKRLSQVRHLAGGRPGLHAGHALLGAHHRQRRCQHPVPHADQPSVRLRDPAPLPRPREGRPLHGLGSLQRQSGSGGVPEHGECRAAQPAGAGRRCGHQMADAGALRPVGGR